MFSRTGFNISSKILHNLRVVNNNARYYCKNSQNQHLKKLPKKTKSTSKSINFLTRNHKKITAYVVCKLIHNISFSYDLDQKTE